MLIAKSIDRTIVVLNPIYYFANHSIIVKALICFSFILPTITMGTAAAIEMTKPDRIIDRVCMLVFFRLLMTD